MAANARGHEARLQVLSPRMTKYVAHRPTPHQAAFLLVPALEAFYGGAAGGGKSEAQLMGSLQYVDVPGYAACLVRQTFQMLAQPGGLIQRSHDWLDDSDATWTQAEHQWRFPSGATLTFRHLQDSGAERNFQGAEYHFIGIDEVTDFTHEQYRFLFSRIRRGKNDRIPLRMRAASNPYGPGLEWCHLRFVIEGAALGRVFIPARLEDNPHLDRDSYERFLKELGPVVYRQLRYGDWTIRPEGGLFKTEWFEGRLIERRQLPPDLRLCRYWDLAATEAIRGRDPDYTAGVLLGRSREGEYFLIDVRRVRSSPLEVERLVRACAEEDAAWATEHGYDRPSIRMEEEPGSSGSTVIDHYRRAVLGEFDFAGVRATGSKPTRAAPVAARAEAGEMSLCLGRWNTGFLDEVVAFPRGTHDDQVDALAGAYEHLARTREVPIVAPISITRPSPWHMPSVTDGWPRP
jgi:predicted phage terminase large subunit-like protein